MLYPVVDVGGNEIKTHCALKNFCIQEQDAMQQIAHVDFNSHFTHEQSTSSLHCIETCFRKAEQKECCSVLDMDDKTQPMQTMRWKKTCGADKCACILVHSKIDKNCLALAIICSFRSCLVDARAVCSLLWL